MVSFDVQNFLEWYSPTCLFLLVLHVILCHIQKVIVKSMSKSFLPMFSSKSFTVSGLKFKSLIHLSWSLHRVSDEVQFILLHADIQFSQHLLLKRLPFPIGCSWYFCQRLVDFLSVSLFLGCLFCPIGLFIFSMPVPYCSTYYSFVI